MDARTLIVVSAVAGYIGGAVARNTFSDEADSDTERLLWGIAGAVAAAWLVNRVKG